MAKLICRTARCHLKPTIRPCLLQRNSVRYMTCSSLVVERIRAKGARPLFYSYVYKYLEHTRFHKHIDPSYQWMTIKDLCYLICRMFYVNWLILSLLSLSKNFYCTSRSIFAWIYWHCATIYVYLSINTPVKYFYIRYSINER